MPSFMTSFRKQDALYLLLATVLVGYYVAFAGGGFPLDDSWIHQGYARNFGLRGEWAFIPGEPSAASTSPLYTVVLSLGYILPISPFLWAHIIGALSLAGIGMLGSRMVEALLPKQHHIVLYVSVMLVLTWHLIWASASGMETALFSFLVMALIYRAWLESDEQKGLLLRGVFFGLLTGLTMLARPEGVMLGGIIGLVILWVRPQGSLKSVILWGIASAISFALIISPYIALNYQLTGGILPNTASAKFEQLEIVLRLPYYERFALMWIPLLAGGLSLFLPGVFYAIRWLWKQPYGQRRWIYFLPLFWSIALIGLYAARLPAHIQHGRYVIPALPPLTLFGAMGMFLMWQDWRRKDIARRVVVQVLFVSSTLMTIAFALIIGPQIYRQDVSIINEEMVATSQWIKLNLSDDDLLAIHDIGAVGYFAPRPMIDVAGLITPEIIPIVMDGDAVWAYLEDLDADYLMAFPNQIPNRDPSDPRLCQIFITNGPTSKSVDGPNMAIYRLEWDADCSD